MGGQRSKEDAVGADAEVAVAHGPDLPLGERGGHVLGIDNEVVIAQGVVFGERHGLQTLTTRPRDCPRKWGLGIRTLHAAGRCQIIETVSETIAEPRPVEAQPTAPEITVRPDLQAAIARSQRHLLGLQHADGYWAGELMVDSTLCSDMIAYHHWNGRVDPKWQRKAVHHILSMQLPDGGWNIYHGGPSEVNATIKAYLALKLAGVPATDSRMLKARQMALSLGGVPRMNTFSRLYLALLGLFPWDYVPTIPCEVILIGKWFHVNFWEMSSWTRSMLVPLSIINHYKPTRRPGNINLDELYPEGYHERDLALRPDPQGFTWRNFFIWLDKLHKFAERFAQHNIHRCRKRALKKSEQWMLERFEGSDGLAAIFPAMLNALIALKALGYPDDHP